MTPLACSRTSYSTRHFTVSCWTLVWFFTVLSGVSQAYGPPLNHRDIAGLWKLTQSKPRPPPAVYYPMKEFTVHPKRDNREGRAGEGTGSYSSSVMENAADQEQQEEEILLMLKEDGSFEQYAENDATQEVVIPDSLKFHNTDEAVLERYFGNIRGQWEYADGNLYLAAERPDNFQGPEDTLLVGKVVATSGDSLQGNPALLQNETSTSASNSEDTELAQEENPTTLQQEKETTPSSSKPIHGGMAGGGSGIVDTHLSVPSGSVNVGKFTYPRKHPAFFDQPMFAPTPKGTFQLKQVLGSLNARNPEAQDELVEKFRVKDFYDKVFLLTASPIGEYKPKGKLRWSLKQNKFVEDPPKKSKKQQEQEDSQPTMIRVMEVKFFANNTFATVGGLGESILRGKFDIVGQDRDQLWMQIMRFGFGRSVSGSVFSEGNSLTKEDEKTYWGNIYYENDIVEKDDDNEPNSNLVMGDNNTPNSKDDHDQTSRLQVKGSVIYGYGLEPQPVARFIMTETTEHGNLDEDEEEDDDDDEESNFEPPNLDDTDGGIDWTDAFQ